MFRGMGRTRYGYALVVYHTVAYEDREISFFYYLPRHMCFNFNIKKQYYMSKVNLMILES